MAAQRPTAIRGLTFLAVLVACRGPDAPPAPERPESLEQVFVVESVVEIGEDPADSIADVGEFLERRAGGFVIADRLLPRIRSYGEDGRLEAAFGRFGDGPFELRQVSGLAETPSGKLVVADSRRSALVYLTRALRPDTIVRVPGTPRRIVSLGPDLIVRMDPFAGSGPSRLVAKPPLFHRLSGGRVAWSAYPAPLQARPNDPTGKLCDQSRGRGGRLGLRNYIADLSHHCHQQCRRLGGNNGQAIGVVPSDPGLRKRRIRRSFDGPAGGAGQL